MSFAARAVVPPAARFAPGASASWPTTPPTPAPTAAPTGPPTAAPATAPVPAPIAVPFSGLLMLFQLEQPANSDTTATVTAARVQDVTFISSPQWFRLSGAGDVV